MSTSARLARAAWYRNMPMNTNQRPPITSPATARIPPSAIMKIANAMPARLAQSVAHC